MSVWKGTLGRSDCNVTNIVKSCKHVFRGFCIGNPLEGQCELPTTLVSRSTQRWRYLNWWIADKFNWRILIRWGYKKWRTTEFLYYQSRTWTTMKFSNVLQSWTKFLAAIMMLENWLSYIEVIDQWILHRWWTTTMVGETWAILATGDAVGETLCWAQVPVDSW